MIQNSPNSSSELAIAQDGKQNEGTLAKERLQGLGGL